MARAGDRSSVSDANGTDTATASSVVRVLSGQDEIREWQEDAYRALHEHPELPHQEVKTAAAAADALREAGYEVHDGSARPASSGSCGMATARPCSCAPTWTRCR